MTITAHAVRPFLVQALRENAVTAGFLTLMLLPAFAIWQAPPCHGHSAEMTLRSQLDGLAHNSDLGDDRGIERTYMLASDQNQAVTGPFERFAAMVKGPVYAPLLDHKHATYRAVQAGPESAAFIVDVTTQADTHAMYFWALSRDPNNGVYRTDNVVRFSSDAANADIDTAIPDSTTLDTPPCGSPVADDG